MCHPLYERVIMDIRCNDGWLSLWECSTRAEWFKRASTTMENWSHATHINMRALRDCVQNAQKTTTSTYHIYRNEIRKMITVYQRPFTYDGEVLVLYELVPETEVIKDSIKR